MGERKLTSIPPYAAYKGHDLVAYHLDCMTLVEISDCTGIDADELRMAMRRRGLIAMSESAAQHEKWRQRVIDLRPAAAVEYLMDFIEVNLAIEPDGSEYADQHLARFNVVLLGHARRVFYAMADELGKHLSRERLNSAMYWDVVGPERIDKMEGNTLAPMLTKLRGLLDGTGFRIENGWGVGWRLMGPDLRPKAKGGGSGA